MLMTSRDPDTITARGLGMTRDGLNRLRSLVAERGRLSWPVGDLLVDVYGPPGPAAVHDGSSERLERLADELGCSRSWLAACRAASAAWPPRERRPTVAWSVQRGLCAYPNRFVLLDGFVKHCERDGVTPSLRRLTVWLDQRDRRAERNRTGRPRADPVLRLERMALRLDHEALAQLVARLTAALALSAAA